MHSRRNAFLLTVLTALAGTLFQLGGCDLGELGKYIANINPCGTILNCNPVEYQFIKSDYSGPGADPNIDPTCTFPPYCPAAGDPFVPAIPGVNA
jgi:hypothetical protein